MDVAVSWSLARFDSANASLALAVNFWASEALLEASELRVLLATESNDFALEVIGIATMAGRTLVAGASACASAVPT